MTLGVDQVAGGLDFPTSITFDPDGGLYVAESGLPFDGAEPGGRISRLSGEGRWHRLRDGLRAPVNGLTYHDGDLLIAEGGQPGRLGRHDLQSGTWSCILDGLPGGGNYHTNMIVPGPEGKLYFGQGAATNSGIVGADANHLAWLRRLPHPHDIPGYEVVLTGENATVKAADCSGTTVTGAFQAYGDPSAAGQRIAAQMPCTAAVMRCDPDGSNLEVVAWGLRNPYGLGFLEDGRLIAVDLGINDRGSRPVANAADCIHEVRAGVWYGWPDFAAGRPVTEPQFLSTRGPAPKMLLANHAALGEVAAPLVVFPVHAAPTRFAVHPTTGALYVALFGDKKPFTGVPGLRSGRALARVDLDSGVVRHLGALPLHRPIDVKFHPLTGALYLLDFGAYEMGEDGALAAKAGSGAVWRVACLDG